MTKPTMPQSQIDVLLNAANALMDSCYAKFERYTEGSLRDFSQWDYEQKCSFGSESDYNLALELLKIVGSYDAQ